MRDAFGRKMHNATKQIATCADCIERDHTRNNETTANTTKRIERTSANSNTAKCNTTELNTTGCVAAWRKMNEAGATS